MLVKHIKKNDTIFIGMLFALLFAFMLTAFLGLYLARSSSLVLYKLILNIIVLAAILGSIYVFFNAMIVIQLLKGKKVSMLLRKSLQFSLGFLYPNTISLSRLFGLDKNKIRAVFSKLNNQLILSSQIQVKAEEILVLLPHCLQKSSCPHKITCNIHNCKRCGLCDIDKLISIRDRYNVKVVVVTGGTLARKIIKDIQPKAIIAVACERDLSSGILEVKHIPVIGILNERPEGPCVNTKVDVKKIEETIEYFIGKEE
ncbi:DUF116 domain-containing protein [Clostridiaceae bacterium 35-E11]